MNTNSVMSLLEQRKKELFEHVQEDIQLFAFVHSLADKSLWLGIEDVPSSQYTNLLPKEDEDRLGEITPYIISLKLNDDFSDWVLNNEKLMKDAFFVTTKSPLEQFSKRYKNIIYGYDDEGIRFYFGFYKADIFSAYINYLRLNEPSQCRGLLSKVEVLYFHKELVTLSRQSELAENRLYFSLIAREFVEQLPEGEQEPSSYIAPKFFEYFSNWRISNYKEDVYQGLIKKYPNSTYSLQDKTNVLKAMNQMIISARPHGITDEVAVALLIEANWVANKNMINEEMANEILSTSICQTDRATLFLETIQQV